MGKQRATHLLIPIMCKAEIVNRKMTKSCHAKPSPQGDYSWPPLQVPGLPIQSPRESWLEGGLRGRESTLVRPTLRGRRRKLTPYRLDANLPYATSCHGHNYNECCFQRQAQGFAKQIGPCVVVSGDVRANGGMALPAAAE